MKKLYYVVISLVLIGCSGEESPQPRPEPELKDSPVANNDTRMAYENEETIIADLTENDEIVENSRIMSFDSQTTEGGTIEDNRNGTYTYTPPADFVGEDSFSYTLCVPGDSERCSSAEVILEVVDGGDPETTDDSVSTMESLSITIETLLANDALVDGSTISSVNGDNSSGSVLLNEDGSVTYIPAEGFTGEDQFFYTICDNDQPEPTCATGTVTVRVYGRITMNVPAALQNYYSDFAVSSNQEINLAFISDFTTDKHTQPLNSYGERHEYLYEADEDLNNPDNVILMYSGESRYWEEYWSDWNDYEPQTFNTEHIYPQSYLGGNEMAENDMHHMRVADADLNSLRLNYPYVESSGEYGLVGEETFYPGDEWIGDVARMVMYIHIRYGEPFSDVGTLEMFLRWNAEDPVSGFEVQRNNVIESAQGNRNPFIDNPYLATLIWGGEPAENKWQ